MTSFRLCDVGMKGGCRGGVLASQEKGGYCFQNDRGHKSELFILLNLPCFLPLGLGIIFVLSRSPLVHPIKRLPIGKKTKKKKKENPIAPSPNPPGILEYVWGPKAKDPSFFLLACPTAPHQRSQKQGLGQPPLPCFAGGATIEEERKRSPKRSELLSAKYAY